MTVVLVALSLFPSMDGGEPSSLPHHEHDCESCIYLGSEFKGVGRDYYFHQGPDGGTLIFRYGSEGDYGSAPLSMSREMAATAGPGSTWSELVSRYDNFVNCGATRFREWIIPVEDEYKTVVGLYNDIRIKETDKTIFFRDSAGNPLGVAQKDAFLASPGQEAFAFRSEPLDGVGQSLFRQLISSRKALFLYVEFLLQTTLDAGG